MLYIKAAEKAVQIGLHSSPPPSDSSSSSSSDSMGRDTSASSASPASYSSDPFGISGLLGDIDAIRAMDGRKPQVPSRCLAVQVRTKGFVLDTSQCVKGLVKELVGPRGDARILRPSPKEGSNGHEGREVRDEVPGHNWHLRQF